LFTVVAIFTALQFTTVNQKYSQTRLSAVTDCHY